MHKLAKLTAALAVCSIPAFPALAVPVQWTTASGGNDHYYDFVSTGASSWAGARAAALASSHLGQQGYLATFTSASEQAFFISQFGAIDGWIGASDEGAEGVWLWMDGPEAGQQFWSGGPGGVSLIYASWNVGEPNNLGNEDYAHFQGGRWNDLPGSASLFYLIEYSSTAAVPEPMTLSLLGAGVAGIGIARRRRA